MTDINNTPPAHSPRSKLEPRLLFALYSKEVEALEKKLGGWPKGNGNPNMVGRQAKRKERLHDLRERLIPNLIAQLSR